MPVGDASYWADPARHGWDELWLNGPGVRDRINLRVTGDERLWPIAWLPTVIPDRVPFRRALSVGCGLGAFERSLAELGLVASVVGVDANPGIVAEAERRAAAANCQDRVRYEAADAWEFLRSARPFDAIFFHESLHHFDGLGTLLELVGSALAPRGILYLDEYVGPSRHEWTWRHLVEWNLAYRSLPSAFRRTGIIRRPISAEDPTEAVASSDILPEVSKRFRVLSRRDYGGNLLAALYPSLRRPDQPNGPSPERFARLIGYLLDREDRLLAQGRESFQAVVVAEPL